ncbi:MAG: glycosyltransferase [Candidatus Synoicihabitans palmerolidicus]|nr:glycosyltransferase [Candidatus Synoicihabitans palmerolidicus]
MQTLAATDSRVDWILESPEVGAKDYGRVLGTIDCLVFPYVRSRYIGRNSSLALDAAATKTLLIVTDRTWMPEFITRYAAGMVCADQDASSLAAAMHEIVVHQNDFRRDAEVKPQLASRDFRWDRIIEFYWTGIPHQTDPQTESTPTSS